MAPPLPVDATGETVRLDQIWYDGRGSLYAASASAAHRLEVGRSPISWPNDVGVAVAGDGYAQRRALVVFVSADGMLTRYRGEAWDAERLVLAPGERVRAVAIDGDADVYVVTDRALHVWAKGRIEPYTLPDDAQGRMREVVVSAGGRAYLVGDEARVLAFDGKIFDRVIPAGSSETALAATWRHAWLSTDGHRLWVRAGDDRVLTVDTRDGATREYTLPRPSLLADQHAPAAGQGGPISGVSFASRDQVITVMNGRAFALERDRFVPLAELPPGEITDLVVEADRGQAVALVDGRPVAFSSEPEPTAAASEANTEEQRQNLERIWRRDERRRRRGAYPSHGLYVPSIDVRLGPSWTVTPGAAAPRTSFALDAGAGVLIAPFEPTDSPTLWVWPQAGYALDTHPDFGHHGVYLATGIGFGGTLFSAFYTPGLLAGAGRDAAMVGFRHGVSGQALWGAVGLEFRHQVQRVGTRTEQDLALMFSLNLAPLIWLPIAANL